MPLNNNGSLKCVLIGDGGVGKTSLVISFATNSFPIEHIPTVFDNYSFNLKVENDHRTVNVWDTAGQEDYENLRQVIYPGTDVFLLCFSIAFPDSLKNSRDIWSAELKKYAPGKPIILIGTKCDLRENHKTIEELKEKNLTTVTDSQGKNLMKEIGAIKYLECSAKTQYGLKEVFEETIRAFIKDNEKAVTKCFLCNIS